MRTFLGMSGKVLTTSQSCLTPYTRASAPPTAVYSPLWSNVTADAPVPAVVGRCGRDGSLVRFHAEQGAFCAAKPQFGVWHAVQHPHPVVVPDQNVACGVKLANSRFIVCKNY